MSPCVRWLQPLLAVLSSSVLSRGLGGGCPPRCLCPDLHTLDCSGRGLTRLPASVPLDVRRLLLSDNGISWIPPDFLVLLSDLVYLDLRNNTLTALDPGTLSTSSRLVFLDLSGNNLTEIPSGTFGASRALIKLRLGDNPYLSAVGRDAFQNLSSLRELELARGGLTALDVGALAHLPSLRTLSLEGNPWVCNCPFGKLFVWLSRNQHKLPTGLAGLACSLLDGRRVALSQLSEASFQECRGVLTLADFLIVIFSGIAVSVVAIVASFFLASTVHCFQRLSKGGQAEDEEGND